MMDRWERERRWLQGAVALGCLVPLSAGSAGVLLGPMLTGDSAGIAGDSHYRYLSGLLLGIGLMFLTTIPGIEQKGRRFRLLTIIVVIGGLGRAVGYAAVGMPDLPMVAALAMELALTPLLCLWQWRIARAFAGPKPRSERTAIVSEDPVDPAAQADKAVSK